MPLSLKISFLKFQLQVREITKQCWRTRRCHPCDRIYNPEVITNSSNLPFTKHASLHQCPGAHVKSATLCLSKKLKWEHSVWTNQPALTECRPLFTQTTARGLVPPSHTSSRHNVTANRATESTPHSYWVEKSVNPKTRETQLQTQLSEKRIKTLYLFCRVNWIMYLLGICTT